LAPFDPRQTTAVFSFGPNTRLLITFHTKTNTAEYTQCLNADCIITSWLRAARAVKTSRFVLKWRVKDQITLCNSHVWQPAAHFHASMNARLFGSENEINTTWSFEDNSATRVMHEDGDYKDLKL